MVRKELINKLLSFKDSKKSFCLFVLVQINKAFLLAKNAVKSKLKA